MSAKVIKAGQAYLVKHKGRSQIVLAENGAHAIDIYLGML